MHTKQAELAIWAFVLLLLSVLGIMKIHRYESGWATLDNGILNKDEKNEDRIFHRLAESNVTSSGSLTVLQDAKVPLASFTTSSGGTMGVTLIQGGFQPDSITPPGVWGSLGKNLILVNSVDEYESVAPDPNGVDPDAISSRINPGCHFSSQKQKLTPGQTDPQPCTGSYKSEGVKLLDNLAIVTYSAPGSVRPCYDFSDEKPDNLTTDCLTHLNEGIANVFKDAAAKDPGADGIVFPAVSTGHGKLNKVIFYRLLFDHIKKELREGDSAALPKQIYLRVDSENDPDAWFDTRFGIAVALAGTVDYWNGPEGHLNAPHWSELTGVCIAVSVMLIVICLKRPHKFLGVSLETLYSRPSWFITGALLFACFGVVRVADTFTSPFLMSSGPWSEMAVSILLSFLVIPITRMVNAGPV